MDTVSKHIRSKIMRAVPQKHSRPEMIVRRMIHAMGYRFRLHRKDLPGTPDVVLPRLKKVIFVHGCFWHRHGCRKATTPSTNKAYWRKKFEENKTRDRRNLRELKELGWNSLLVWECWTKRPDWLRRRLQDFLEMA